jgi:hypothetical protein
MENNIILYLPVSLGEAIDKLTILDIKLEKIKDNIHVQKEYDLLYDKINNYIDKNKELYVSMKKINLIIWNQMDTLRNNDLNEEEYLRLCKECIDCNDIRFRIKNKINFNSILKEQKSYKKTKLLLVINCEINNDIIEYIKYNSFIFDEVYIPNNNSLEEVFKYDKFIKFKNTHIFNKKIIINNSNEIVDKFLFNIL